MPRFAKASDTPGEDSATRSLTRHVMHHAAVAFTNTGVPCARNWARRSGVNGSHRAPRGAVIAADDALDAASGPIAMAAATQPRAIATATRRHRRDAMRVP